MKKKQTVLFLLVLLAITVLLGSCSNRPKTDSKKEKAIEEYFVPLQTEGDLYFNELIWEAIGAAEIRVTLGFRYVENDYLRAGTKSIAEILGCSYPVLYVGLNKSDSDSFTEEEIHDILAEAKQRNITVDFFFNGNDRIVYQVRETGVTMDKTTGKDGGALHETEDYIL